MFNQFKDMAAALGQAKEFKAKMEQLQNELGQKTVTADAGAGAVRVTANGRLEIVHVHLDPPLVATLTGQSAEADQQMVQDLIAAATNAALAKARQLIQQEMSRLGGGLNLAGLLGPAADL